MVSQEKFDEEFQQRLEDHVEDDIELSEPETDNVNEKAEEYLEDAKSEIIYAKKIFDSVNGEEDVNVTHEDMNLSRDLQKS